MTVIMQKTLLGICPGKVFFCLQIAVAYDLKI
nr:MAG TPA: hypothetical protein [Caudoviricetes sp.]